MGILAACMANLSGYKQEFMDRAIELSIVGYKSGKGLPIGCVITKNGNIVGEGHNEVLLRRVPTAHAEMVAIEHACRTGNTILLEGCELYTSLQPCPMCFGAVYWAGIQTVYYANSAEDAAVAGLDDAFIYQELMRPPGQQLIPMHHIKDSAAQQVLADWKKTNPVSVAGRHQEDKLRQSFDPGL